MNGCHELDTSGRERLGSITASLDEDTLNQTERNLRAVFRVPETWSGNSDLIASAKVGDTTKGKPGGAGNGYRWQLPFLENSTACQKSTPDMLIPRPPHYVVDVVPLKKSFPFCWGRRLHSEDAVDGSDYSSGSSRSCVETFTESLILAQDERWRRA